MATGEVYKHLDFSVRALNTIRKKKGGGDRRIVIYFLEAPFNFSKWGNFLSFFICVGNNSPLIIFEVHYN